MAEEKICFKRTLEDFPNAFFINVMDGEKFNIKAGENFIVGRSLLAALLIEEIYISRIQCVVKYENNNFAIYDNSTSSGTFINFEKMHKKDNPHILKHGDILSFGKGKTMEYAYRFVLDSNSGKKLKSEENEVITSLTEKNDKLKSEISKLNDVAVKLNSDHQILKENMKAELNRFTKEIGNLTTIIETQKQNLETEKYCMDALKRQINSHLEDNFLCSICSEIVVKATIGNCNHSFCEDCISTWLSKSRLCPVCRTVINSTSNFISIDNFITEICELMGGTIKEQRDVLQRERKIPTSVRGRPKLTARKRQTVTIPLERARPRPSSMRSVRPEDVYRDIEFVDLTHLQ